MTFQEAIKDPNRPLSMTPQEWMQYEEAKENEEVEVVDQTSKQLYVQEMEVPEEQADEEFDAVAKLEIGIEQMVLGCRIALRALNELGRQDVMDDTRLLLNHLEEMKDALKNIREMMR
jgi:hypothetical protein